MKGKEKCKALKEIRRQIAEKNDIPYVVSQCKYQGDCLGTCPKCEAELRYLERELAIRQGLGKAVATFYFRFFFIFRGVLFRFFKAVRHIALRFSHICFGNYFVLRIVWSYIDIAGNIFISGIRCIVFVSCRICM